MNISSEYHGYPRKIRKVLEPSRYRDNPDGQGHSYSLEVSRIWEHNKTEGYSVWTQWRHEG